DPPCRCKNQHQKNKRRRRGNRQPSRRVHALTLALRAARFWGSLTASRRDRVTATAAESSEATHTAGRISSGLADPCFKRSAATVVGSSWIDAVFSATNVIMWFEAVPSSLLIFDSSPIARIPSGVAAF